MQVKEYLTYKYKKIIFTKNQLYILNKSYKEFDANPKFGKLFKIYEQNNSLKIIFIIYEVVNFDDLKLIYEVQTTNQLELLDLNNANLCHFNLISEIWNEKEIIFKTI